jgi:hypothetical protein
MADGLSCLEDRGSNLAHPDANVTGFTQWEYSMAGKWLSLLKDVAPRLAQAAVLFNPNTLPFGSPPCFLSDISGWSLSLVGGAAAPTGNRAARWRRLLADVADSFLANAGSGRSAAPGEQPPGRRSSRRGARRRRAAGSPRQSGAL